MPSSARSTTPNTYTLSLHDALPILDQKYRRIGIALEATRQDEEILAGIVPLVRASGAEVVIIHIVESATARFIGTDTDESPHPAASDRKSTRLNSSHRCSSYAVFCSFDYTQYIHSFPTRRSSDLGSEISPHRHRSGSDAAG